MEKKFADLKVKRSATESAFVDAQLRYERRLRDRDLEPRGGIGAFQESAVNTEPDNIIEARKKKLEERNAALYRDDEEGESTYRAQKPVDFHDDDTFDEDDDDETDWQSPSRLNASSNFTQATILPIITAPIDV